jgi:hypothetical protein
MHKSLLFGSLLALAACAQATETVNSDVTTAKLRTDTAVYFNTSPSRVQVGNMRQGVLGTAYQARVSGRVFDCHYFRSSVSCERA